MKKVSLFAGLILAIGLVFGGLCFAGTDGAYAVKQQTPGGEQDVVIQLNADGTGYYENEFGKSDFKDAKIEGNKFEINGKGFTPFGEMEMVFKGTVEGDKISGTCSMMMGDFTFTGQRK